jgi:hypothetical protein
LNTALQQAKQEKATLEEEKKTLAADKAKLEAEKTDFSSINSYANSICRSVSKGN